MPEICPRYAQDMPEICARYARDMRKIFPRYAQDKPEKYAKKSWGKMSTIFTQVGAKCPWGILSWGILSFGAKCLGAKCLLADFSKRRTPFNWTYSKENVLKSQKGNQGGTQRRHVLGEGETKEETSVQEPHHAAQEGVRYLVCSKAWLTSWSGT